MTISIIITIIVMYVLILLITGRSGRVHKVVFLLMLPQFMNASILINFDKMITVLKRVESNNNKFVIGDNGKAYGILQIHYACINDVNRNYGTNYSHQDAFNVNKAEKIFKLYILMGYIKYRLKHNRSPTEYDMVRMWNGGIYQGYRIHSTENYLKSYLKRKYDKTRISTFPKNRYDASVVLLLHRQRWKITEARVCKVFL